MVTPGFEGNEEILDALASAAAQVAAEATMQAVAGQLEELVSRAGIAQARVDMSALERAVQKATRSVRMREAKGQNIDTNLIEAVVRAVLQEEDRTASGQPSSRHSYRQNIAQNLAAGPSAQTLGRQRTASQTMFAQYMSQTSGPGTGRMGGSPAGGPLANIRRGGPIVAWGPGGQVTQGRPANYSGWWQSGNRRRRASPDDVPQQDMAGDDIYEGLLTGAFSTDRRSVGYMNPEWFRDNPYFQQQNETLRTGRYQAQWQNLEDVDPRVMTHTRLLLSDAEDVRKFQQRVRNAEQHAIRQQSYEASRWSGILGGAGYGAGSMLSQMGLPGGAMMGRMASMARMGGQLGVGMSMMGIGTGRTMVDPESGEVRNRGGWNMAMVTPMLGGFAAALSLGIQGLRKWNEEVGAARTATMKTGMTGEGGIFFTGYGGTTGTRKDFANTRFADAEFWRGWDQMSQEDQSRRVLDAVPAALMARRHGMEWAQGNFDSTIMQVIAHEEAMSGRRPGQQARAMRWGADQVRSMGIADVNVEARAVGESYRGGLTGAFAASGYSRNVGGLTANELNEMGLMLRNATGLPADQARNLIQQQFGTEMAFGDPNKPGVIESLWWQVQNIPRQFRAGSGPNVGFQDAAAMLEEQRQTNELLRAMLEESKGEALNY